MTTRTVYPHCALPELDPALDVAWRTWLQRHGMPDPLDIPRQSEIICDDDARTVTVMRFVSNRDGRRMFDRDREEFITEWVTVQLEARALPIPDGYLVTVD